MKDKKRAIVGCDYVRNSDWNPVYKYKKGWLKWADRQVKYLSRRDKIKWHAIVAYIPARNAFRISFAAQTEL